MSQTSSTSGVRGLILRQLSHPLKLRLALCVAVIASWQAIFLGPLNDNVAATTSRIGVERKRAATAREIEKLKTALKPHSDLIGAGEDEQEMMRQVIARIRSSPLRLVNLKPEKAKDLGPFAAVGLQLNLAGRYVDIDEFLGWAEADTRLFRIDSIRLVPNTREPGHLQANILLLALVDKAAPAAKAKRESGAVPAAKAKRESGAAPAAKAKRESGAVPAAKAKRESGAAPAAKARGQSGTIK